MLTLYLSLLSTEAERSRFEEVYSQCRKQMIVIATSILKNEADAEDVVHDVFLFDSLISYGYSGKIR